MIVDLTDVERLLILPALDAYGTARMMTTQVITKLEGPPEDPIRQLRALTGQLDEESCLSLRRHLKLDNKP